MGGIPQFKVRRIDGVTELRLRDDRALMRELAANFKDFAVFLDEGARGTPSFADLKNNHTLQLFLHCTNTPIHLELCVRTVKASIIAKEVHAVDGDGRLRAVCRWQPDKGVSFEAID
jgi:hypothetical protein